VKPFNERWSVIREKPEVLQPVILRLINALDELDSLLEGALVIHCLYDADRQNGSYHLRGMAADVHIQGLHPIDQFLYVERQQLFTGIGIYGSDVWHNPGLHVDLRDGRAARWAFKSGKDGKREEVALDKIYVSYLLSIMP